MSKPYSPPYNPTSAIVSLVARIGEAVGRLSAHEAAATSLRLRRINRIRNGRAPVQENAYLIRLPSQAHLESQWPDRMGIILNTTGSTSWN